MSEPFCVVVAVRGYELDVNGHLNWANYLHYAEHARWECLRAAGQSLRPVFVALYAVVVVARGGGRLGAVDACRTRARTLASTAFLPLSLWHWGYLS